MKKNEKLVTTPPRIRIKRAIFQALNDFQSAMPPEYQFTVKQDFVGFLNTLDWKKNQRLVVLYMNDVENNYAYDAGTETASFEFFCIVSPDKNDDTIAFEALNLLADQVRCCIWGCGAGLGMNKIMPDDIRLEGYKPFNFRPDNDNRLSTERIVSKGVISLSISYQVKEYSNIQEIFGSGVDVVRVEGVN